MSTKILGSPSKYIQGRNVFNNLEQYLKNYGTEILMLCDSYILPLIEKKIVEGLKNSDIHITFAVFGGESTELEMERVSNLAQDNDCTAIIGCGGGKTIDTAKAVGFKSNIFTIVMPTAASTDAPCSSLSVVYTEDGIYEYNLFLPHNPSLILVDTEIIANAPVRLLVSGIGDAFATYYEARACRLSDADNMFQGKATNSAFELAKLCKKILLADGYQAVMAVQNKIVTKSLENVIEANIYLSGVGFESNGCAIAHGFYNGFTTLGGKHTYLHGECVAFGTLVQLIVENVSKEELQETYAFFRKIGLPTTLKQLGVEKISEKEIIAVALASCNNEITHNMPFKVEPDMLVDAITMANILGQEFEEKGEM